jgi:enoyl-CoA hydratase
MTPRFEHRGSSGVELITLDEPASRNAISVEVAGDLDTEFARIADDDTVQVVVITGADPTFCAGMDLKDIEAGRRISLGFIARIAAFSKPVIAAINGVASTGGLELALACHVRIASDRAQLFDLHAQLGMLPAAGASVRLPRLIGLSRALEMAVTGRRVNAEEALAIGLVDRLAPHEGLLEEALETAESMARVEPRVIDRLLPLYRNGVEGDSASALEAEWDTAQQWRREHDVTKARERFSERRTAGI